ncbi:MAG: two-component system, NtrC family, response regulator HydG [Candidatus Binatota bacterium]|jgi:DNA-binding NtrC family response regulator|nr:two-component system, NtrC family, response regulator HydG [Candidatus Binatota bacterium]
MHVLVIDDDEIFCRLLVEILESKGIETTATTDGLAGYELLIRNRFDLFIIDVRMPLILGTELAEAIKETNAQARIILASAFADSKLADFAAEKGIFLLSKPFNLERLFETLEQALPGSLALS